MLNASSLFKTTQTRHLHLTCRSGYWGLRDFTDPWTMSTPRNKTRRAAVARYVAAATMQLPASPDSPPRTEPAQVSHLGPMRHRASPPESRYIPIISMLGSSEEGRGGEGRGGEGIEEIQLSRNSLQETFFSKISKQIAVRRAPRFPNRADFILRACQFSDYKI